MKIADLLVPVLFPLTIKAAMVASALGLMLLLTHCKQVSEDSAVRSVSEAETSAAIAMKLQGQTFVFATKYEESTSLTQAGDTILAFEIAKQQDQIESPWVLYAYEAKHKRGDPLPEVPNNLASSNDHWKASTWLIKEFTDTRIKAIKDNFMIELELKNDTVDLKFSEGEPRQGEGFKLLGVFDFIFKPIVEFFIVPAAKFASETSNEGVSTINEVAETFQAETEEIRGIIGGPRDDLNAIKARYQGNIQRLSPKNTDWMWRMSEKIHYVPLKQLAIPGSHDAGSYSIPDRPDLCMATDDQDILGPSNIPVVGRVLQNLMAAEGPRWAVTQNLNITQQLEIGMRAFDMRVCKQNARYWIQHSYLGSELGEILVQIAAFARSHPKELIILRFTELFGLPTAADHGAFWDYTFTKLGEGRSPAQSRIAPSQPLSADSTVSDFWKADKNIVILVQLFLDSGPYARSPFPYKDYIWVTPTQSPGSHKTRAGSVERETIINNLMPITERVQNYFHHLEILDGPNTATLADDTKKGVTLQSLQIPLNDVGLEILTGEDPRFKVIQKNANIVWYDTVEFSGSPGTTVENKLLADAIIDLNNPKEAYAICDGKYLKQPRCIGTHYCLQLNNPQDPRQGTKLIQPGGPSWGLTSRYCQIGKTDDQRLKFMVDTPYSFLCPHRNAATSQQAPLSLTNDHGSQNCKFLDTPADVQRAYYRSSSPSVIDHGAPR